MSRIQLFAALVLTIILSNVGWGQDVTVSQDDTSFTMANGIITVKVAKSSGDLIGLKYKDIETMEFASGHAGGYWSHAANAPEMIRRITIDPKTNGGARAEVSVKGIANGHKLGRPAGLAAGAEGDFPADIEIRYSLGRGESGVYTYCILDHKPEYPAGSIGEARYFAKIAHTFDWMLVDAQRNKYYPEELPGEDKYVYTAVQSENLAYGWASTKDKIGWFIVNPTIEYLSGGPTKVEFLCHRDTTAVQAPCVLNYWRSSHYGGAVLPVAEGETWTKVVGPFMIYVNSGSDPQAIWKDALNQAQKEAAKWPYDWISSCDYPHKNERATVSGQFVLNDPLMPGGARFAGKIMVGLAAPTYMMGAGRQVTWQTDAKHYEMWSRSDDKSGKFSITNVRPGKHTLYAYADGILGQYEKADVTIEPGGKPVDLGKLEWKPVRRGKQLWDVGIPNRTAKEYANGDKYFEPDVQLQYPKMFPNDVNYVVGKSDFSKDWYFEQVPHNEDPNAQVRPFFGVQGNGRATPFAISFDLPSAPKGRATLRLAFSAAGTRSIGIEVNDKQAGNVDQLPGGDSTVTRHGVQGIWFEREFSFDASMLKQGTNTLKLIVPAGPINNGVMYDYVRLELDENATAQ